MFLLGIEVDGAAPRAARRPRAWCPGCWWRPRAIFTGAGARRADRASARGCSLQPAVVSVPVAFVVMIGVALGDPHADLTLPAPRCWRCTRPRGWGCGSPRTSSRVRRRELQLVSCAFPGVGRPTFVRAIRQHATSTMHGTTPSVFLIARPAVDTAGMRAYLEDVGGASWPDRREQEEEGVPGPGASCWPSSPAASVTAAGSPG